MRAVNLILVTSHTCIALFLKGPTYLVTCETTVCRVKIEHISLLFLTTSTALMRLCSLFCLHHMFIFLSCLQFHDASYY